jgi:hypothetical protein
MTERVCLSMIFALATLLAAGGDQVVQGRGGEYSVRVPAGWRTDVDAAGVEASGDRVRMRLRFSEMLLSLKTAMGTVAGSTETIWRGVRSEESSARIGGNSALINVFRGVDENGARMVRRVAFFNPIPPDPGSHTYVFMFDVAERDYQAALPRILQIEASFQVGGASRPPVTAAPPAGPAGPVIPAVPDEGPMIPPVQRPDASPYDAPPATRPSPGYRDPRGRFQAPVPPNWRADGSEDGVRISRGNSYVNVIVAGTAAPPAALIQRLAQQIGGQWKGFRMVQNGQWTLAGQPSEWAVFTGTNPRGAPALMRIVAGSGFVLLMSVPQNEWEQVKGDLEQIETGFSTGQPGPWQAGGGQTGGGQPAGEPAGGRASLGVACHDVNTREMWQQSGGVKEGAVVNEIGPGSPAEKACFRIGDVIVAMDREPIRGVRDLMRVMSGKKPGDWVQIVVLRGGKPLEFLVSLAGRP